jgi:hypothetical protein
MKWERIFKDLLGFKNQEIASQFMNEMHTKLIYLNSGVFEVPTQLLEEISAYFSMPVEVINIDLVHLENAIKKALNK